MKRLKAIALLMGAGFLLFAPPGTLIVLALLIAGWIGGLSSVIAVIVGVGVLGAGWIIVRARRERKGRRSR